MSKIIIIIDDSNGGTIRSIEGPTVVAALRGFLQYDDTPTKATTLKGVLSHIKKWYSELPFIWAIIADGKLIYNGVTIKENIYITN